MTISGQLNQNTADSDLEFALETQSGFLVVVKGSGNDGRVSLAVRRRVGTPPSSSIALAPDEVKRLINLLGELSPTALTERDRMLVGKAREAYLDDLIGANHEPESAALDLFIERDFPELANKRKKHNQPRTFLGAESSNPFYKLQTAIQDFKIQPKQIAMVGGVAAILLVLALSAVAVLNFKPFASHKTAEPEVAAVSPSAGLDEFSKTFVLQMLTFKKETYRQSQVQAMASMTPELAQKYWLETGFPLTRAQLKSIPQDQEVIVSNVASLVLSDGVYQVDVYGQVLANAGAKNMPLHIRLTVTKEASGKFIVSEQKDLSSVEPTAPVPATDSANGQNMSGSVPTNGTTSAAPTATGANTTASNAAPQSGARSGAASRSNAQSSADDSAAASSREMAPTPGHAPAPTPGEPTLVDDGNTTSTPGASADSAAGEPASVP